MGGGGWVVKGEGGAEGGAGFGRAVESAAGSKWGRQCLSLLPVSIFPTYPPAPPPLTYTEELTDYTPLWYSMGLQWQTLPKQETSCLQNPAYRPRRF